jgi:histidine triad (HIT) family protein
MKRYLMKERRFRMVDCLFCRIVAGEIPAKTVYEDETVLAFEDVSPQAPVHILIIPKKHIATINDITSGDESLVGHIYSVAAKIARDRGVADTGYRVTVNCNSDAGQAVFHLHFHLLGGRKLTWPPG